MTTRSRRLLQLGLTGVALTLSGCFGSSGPSASCLAEEYFNVSWNVDFGADMAALQCNEAIANGAGPVQLETNFGVLPVGMACERHRNGNFTYEFLGSTSDATQDRRIRPGMYVISASLLHATTGAVLSTASGPGPGFPITACNGVDLAYFFTI